MRIPPCPPPAGPLCTCQTYPYPTCARPTCPSVSITSARRGGEAAPSLHTAQFDSLPPKARPGHRSVLRQACRPSGAMHTAHADGHTCSQTPCPLAHSDVYHIPNTDTHAMLCTPQHTGHTLTHAHVASYGAHTLQTEMHRFSCLSCDSQMVGFSQRATI